ncbi:MAG: glycoside hydrolase family 3 N-terminal domain-containing protein [Vulcanimicrobiota bacterium]
MPRLFLLLLIAISFLPCAADERIDKLLSEMTWAEKLGQLTQYAGSSTGPVPLKAEMQERVGRGEVGSVLSIAGVARVRQLQQEAVEKTRLGIPLVFAYDVIHGYRTVFPIPLAEAASFDPELAEQSARIAAREATAAGIAWNFAPMVDIARDPRWGRCIEGSGEDPYLGSVMAAARVRGFQGKNLKAADTMAACAKHFAGYGAAEGGRDYDAAEISERTLRQVYLPPFQAAVEAGAITIMAGFQEVSGVPAHANPFLLEQVLRQEWGFDGLVVSDYNAIRELMAHRIAATPHQAGELALQAGVDMDMMGDIYRDLPETPETRALVDRSVRRVLELKERLGLFDDPYRYLDEEAEKRYILAPEHRQAARRAAQRSAVLLKNDGGVLPLAKPRRLALLGSLATDSTSLLGAWNTAGKPEETTNLLEGFRQALPGAEVVHADETDLASALAAARGAESVVLVLGEIADWSGESRNRTRLGLPPEQLAMALEVARLGKPTVVLLMHGRPLAIPELADKLPAILDIWHPGSMGAAAATDLVFGQAAPGGKLPMTFPRAVGQVPIYYNHKTSGRPAQAGVERYTIDYVDESLEPLFPFGHGLSYTTFAYSDLRLEGKLPLRVAVTVKNTGRRAGDEVVQVYVRDEARSITPPERELKGFRRVTLAPGEARQLTFDLDRSAFSFIGQDLKETFEPGQFTIFVGGDSRATLSAEVTL